MTCLVSHEVFICWEMANMCTPKVALSRQQERIGTQVDGKDIKLVHDILIMLVPCPVIKRGNSKSTGN